MDIDLQEIELVVANALSEDYGKGDITSELIVAKDKKTAMAFIAREDIVVCGIPVLIHLFCRIDMETGNGEAKFTELVKEGEFVKAGTKIATVKGNARAILAGERTALNILQHMSAIATYTKRFVDAVHGTKAVILDTRKTLPGLREIEKYAVFTGGGTNHRKRLDDGILIKDNHIHIAGGVTRAVKLSRENLLERLRNPGEQEVKLVKEQGGAINIEVECDTIEQVKEAIEAGADILLLDNMDIKTLKEAVKIAKGEVKLEASGGVTLENVEKIAKTGVDFISIGALTHSAPNVDIGLDVV